MGKEVDLSKKTITEDKDGNALITGKLTSSVQPTDNNDLTTKLYVDNAIATSCITATETQTLTDDQKSTARSNIGAVGGKFENGILKLYLS